MHAINRWILVIDNDLDRIGVNTRLGRCVALSLYPSDRSSTSPATSVPTIAGDENTENASTTRTTAPTTTPEITDTQFVSTSAPARVCVERPSTSRRPTSAGSERSESRSRRSRLDRAVAVSCPVFGRRTDPREPSARRRRTSASNCSPSLVNCGGTWSCDITVFLAGRELSSVRRKWCYPIARQSMTQTAYRPLRVDCRPSRPPQRLGPVVAESLVISSRRCSLRSAAHRFCRSVALSDNTSACSRTSVDSLRAAA